MARPAGRAQGCFGNDHALPIRYFDKTQEHDDDTVKNAMDWKGLESGRMPVFLGYDQTERMIAALLDRATQWQPDVVVGIARGGLVPATMAAGILALPLAMIGFDRAREATEWIGAPPAAQRVLLVDDGCSTGRTMEAVRAGVLREGRDCLTLAVVHDPEVTSYVPDLSHPMRALWRFPWERGEATPAGRALRATGAGPDRPPNCRSTAWTSTACSCPTCRTRSTRPTSPPPSHERHGLEPFATLPYFSPDRAVVITGRPDDDRERTQAWLTRWGHGALPLECRPTRPAAHAGRRRALQGGGGDALGLHAFRGERRRAGAAHRRTCAASGGELVVRQ